MLFGKKKKSKKMEDGNQNHCGNEMVKICFDWMESVFASLICVVILFTLFFRIVNVSGPSMLPTLRSNDRVLIRSLGYRPRRNDIVVITHTAMLNEPIIKRVIALENDTVDIDFQTGIITVNGRILEESSDRKKGLTEQNSDFQFPLTVPKGHVFVLGDNRSISNDSRFRDVGMIDEHNILGRAECILLPFDRAGVIYIS